MGTRLMGWDAMEMEIKPRAEIRLLPRGATSHSGARFEPTAACAAIWSPSPFSFPFTRSSVADPASAFLLHRCCCAIARVCLSLFRQVLSFKTLICAQDPRVPLFQGNGRHEIERERKNACGCGVTFVIL